MDKGPGSLESVTLIAAWAMSELDLLLFSHILSSGLHL